MADETKKKEQPPSKSNGSWDVDLAWWKTKQLRIWQRFAQTGNFEELIGMAMTAIKGWPHEGDVNDMDVWDELSPQESTEAISKVTEKVRDFFR